MEADYTKKNLPESIALRKALVCLKKNSKALDDDWNASMSRLDRQGIESSPDNNGDFNARAAEFRQRCFDLTILADREDFTDYARALSGNEEPLSMLVVSCLYYSKPRSLLPWKNAFQELCWLKADALLARGRPVFPVVGNIQGLMRFDIKGYKRQVLAETSFEEGETGILRRL